MGVETKQHYHYSLCIIDPVYHVLLPNQPSISRPGHGILKFKLPGNISIISPAIGDNMVEVALIDIRRIGYMYNNNTDIVWLETCKSCKNTQDIDQFLFVIVPSGTVTAQALTKEIKIAIERVTGVFLILEETTQLEMTFVSRNHYGCPCFSQLSRNRILMGGLNECFEKRLVKYQRSSEPILNIGTSQRDAFRKPSDTLSNFGLSLEEYVTQPHRRGTIYSCSPTTPHPPRQMLSRGPTSLDRLRQTSISSVSSQNSMDMTEEVHTPLSDAVFDMPTPVRRISLTHKDSLSSSHDSGGSIASASLDQEDHDITPIRRLSLSRPDLHRPFIPPRSPASLKLMRAKTPTAL